MGEKENIDALKRVVVVTEGDIYAKVELNKGKEGEMTLMNERLGEGERENDTKDRNRNVEIFEEEEVGEMSSQKVQEGAMPVIMDIVSQEDQDLLMVNLIISL